MTLIPFVLRLLASMDFSDSTKHVQYVTENNFFGESLLLIYWSNVSVEFRQNLMDYLVKSKIVTVESCNCDHVTEVFGERSYVKNTIVLFGDMVPERRHIENMRHCLSWNARSKILTIINDSDDIVNVTLNKIWMLTKAINVIVMVCASTSVRYYTLYPYDNFKVMELDQNGLFPPKPMNNLHGSVISVATTHSQPYVLTSDTPNEYSEGLEVRIINAIAKKFKFKIKFVIPPNGENPWLVWSKGKLIGNFGLLHRCEADILFFGLLARNDLCLLADVTAVHTIDKSVWVVPTRPFSFNWKSIIKLFTNELWAFLWATLILIALTLYLITKYEFGSPKTSFKFVDAFFQTFGVHLMGFFHFYRKRQLYRLFVFMISYYTMIIAALYQSSLITYLTTLDSENQYKNIGEAIDDGLMGYFFLPAKAGLNTSDHDLWNRILKPGKHGYSISGIAILLDVAHNKTKFSLFTSHFVNFIIQRNLLDDKHEPMVRTLWFSDQLYMISMYVSKGHPLKTVIDDGILRLNEAGILEQWMKEIAAGNEKIQKDVGIHDGGGPKPLSFEHLKGAFYIIGIMLTISWMLFVAEIGYYYWYVKKCKKKH